MRRHTSFLLEKPYWCHCISQATAQPLTLANGDAAVLQLCWYSATLPRRSGRAMCHLHPSDNTRPIAPTSTCTARASAATVEHRRELRSVLSVGLGLAVSVALAHSQTREHKRSMCLCDLRAYHALPSPSSFAMAIE